MTKDSPSLARWSLRRLAQHGQCAYRRGAMLADCVGVVKRPRLAGRRTRASICSHRSLFRALYCCTDRRPALASKKPWGPSSCKSNSLLTHQEADRLQVVEGPDLNRRPLGYESFKNRGWHATNTPHKLGLLASSPTQRRGIWPEPFRRLRVSRGLRGVQFRVVGIGTWLSKQPARGRSKRRNSSRPSNRR